VGIQNEYLSKSDIAPLSRSPRTHPFELTGGAAIHEGEEDFSRVTWVRWDLLFLILLREKRDGMRVKCVVGHVTRQGSAKDEAQELFALGVSSSGFAS
jgi:hypothetical protein